MTDVTGTPRSDAPPTAPHPERGHTLYRALAWVGIIAGVVFIVGVVFAAGLALGGGNPGWHRGGPAGSSVGGCPMMKSGAMKDGPVKEGPTRDGPTKDGPMRGGMHSSGTGPMAPERIPSAPEPG